LPELEEEPRWRQIFRLVTLNGPDYPSRRIARRITFYTLLGLSAVFGAMCGLMVVYSIDLPQMEDLARYRPNTTTELLDVHGRVFGSFALERRVVVPYSDFPLVLRQAIISIEDKSFERNWGVNLVRAMGAAYRDLHAQGRAQGASTLTMQLARNLFLSSEKTYGRKIQEVFLSMQIERRFTKQQIFALYANQIYLGRGTYGFEAGSEYYFSKHVRDLTLPEAALLAALPKGPEYYSPVRYPERALKRRNLVRLPTAWLLTLWRRCGGSWRRSMASRRSMVRDFGFLRRSISICRWLRTRLCWRVPQPMSDAVDGRVGYRISYCPAWRWRATSIRTGRSHRRRGATSTGW
jgi:penicillin-binding protein 1A